jgi:hypothetical protein
MAGPMTGRSSGPKPRGRKGDDDPMVYGTRVRGKRVPIKPNLVEFERVFEKLCLIVTEQETDRRLNVETP